MSTEKMFIDEKQEFATKDLRLAGESGQEVKSAVVCTLFENDYHYGVAVLVNSLIAKGYKGHFFAGYRNDLPEWAKKASSNELLAWDGATTLHISEELKLHFLPLSTETHLTNFKPNFMLQLWDGPAKNASEIFYLDPDIVVATDWTFFEEWAGYGVAICEDVNSPIASNHPRRRGWRKYFLEYAIELNANGPAYANGGFVGISRRDRNFLELWKTIQECMAKDIGGLHNSQFNEGHANKLNDPNYMFSKTDQDALNASLEAWNGEISFVGKEAMGFANSGPCILPHAIGMSKPWCSSALRMALRGYPPRLIDHTYLQNARGSILVHSKAYCLLRKLELQFAGLIGRFYRRM